MVPVRSGSRCAADRPSRWAGLGHAAVCSLLDEDEKEARLWEEEGGGGGGAHHALRRRSEAQGLLGLTTKTRKDRTAGAASRSRASVALADPRLLPATAPLSGYHTAVGAPTFPPSHLPSF